MNHPEWAEAKIKFYLAKCWAADIDTEEPTIEGINWFHDKLFFFCAWYHNTFVQPFFVLEGFPFKVLEIYKKNKPSRTLENLKCVLRNDICTWCPLGVKDEPCTRDERGEGDAMCQQAKDNRAEYVWETFCK